MKPVLILVHGKHPEILATVIRLVNANPEWEASGSVSEEEMYELFEQKDFDLVLLGGGILAEREQVIRRQLKSRKPNIRIIQHFGGGSGLLKSEIEQAIHADAV